MTWTPGQYLLEGELDNTRPGKVTGWLRFAGMGCKVILDLEGDFAEEARRTKLRLSGEYWGSEREAFEAMRGFARIQVGKVGRITSG